MGAALPGAKSKGEKKEKNEVKETEMRGRRVMRRRWWWQPPAKQSVDQSLQAWPLGRGLCSGRDHRPAAMLSIHRHRANDRELLAGARLAHSDSPPALHTMQPSS